MIKLANINKIFETTDKPVYALKDVSLSVKKGEIFGVIGSSGAGKSTLIRCVNLLETPTSGSIQLDGVELTKLNKTELCAARRQIGMIFQHFNLLSSRTVFDNVALPLELAGVDKAAIKNKITPLLELVGLETKHNAYPSELSGGQKQRVAIARALASEPKVLLCDEATSALDPSTTKSILALLKDINARLGLTILLITHEMEVVKNICHKVAIIDKGELIEQNTVAKFFANPQTELAQLFIEATINLEIPDEYKQRLSLNRTTNSMPLVRLGFTGNSVDTAVISEVSRALNVDVNILSADIEFAGGIKFGYMLAELIGNKEDTIAAKAFFQQHAVNVEVIGYVD
ncbi:Methionine ABC transporter ATP-binding protein [Moritella sp. JT01]|uniref:methionine ABC transporter ATP-binding protein MetN n=1 Tax=Moritella sp. JT01 TaxID=756698 RepID=UPI0007978E0F|nr:methionine ABC transporter ATP-binding protein MetN [Moritella sp. JT01]KXO08806.1 Methionine ABC transporter ATP-binding protein [Moritella sp. JT01]